MRPSALWMRRLDASRPALAVAIALLVLPALDIAIALVQRLIAWGVAPRRLPRLDFSDGVPEDARTMVVVPTLLDQHRGRRRAARAPGGAGARQPGSAHPLRHPRRLRRRADRRARRRRGDPVGRDAKASSISTCGSARDTPIGSSCFIASGAGIRASASGWAGSASAARSRSSTGCCAAPATRRSRRRSASWTCCRACATASRSTPTRACRATRRSRSSASSRIR